MVDSEENYKFDLGVKGLNLPYGTLHKTSQDFPHHKTPQ